MFGSAPTQNSNAVLRLIRGSKKRESLDVIPMSVSEKQGEIDGTPAKLFAQLRPELTNPGARIKDDEIVLPADLNTGCVAAVAESGSTWSGNRSAHPPEANGDCGLERRRERTGS